MQNTLIRETSLYLPLLFLHSLYTIYILFLVDQFCFHFNIHQAAIIQLLNAILFFQIMQVQVSYTSNTMSTSVS